MELALIAALTAVIPALGGLLVEWLNRRRREHEREVVVERARRDAARSYSEAMAEGSPSRLPPRLRAQNGASLEQRVAALA